MREKLLRLLKKRSKSFESASFGLMSSRCFPFIHSNITIVYNPELYLLTYKMFFLWFLYITIICGLDKTLKSLDIPCNSYFVESTLAFDGGNVPQ